MFHTNLDKSAKTLVLGIGNTLLSDEGIGIHVLRTLQQKTSSQAGIEFLDGGTLSFTLARPIEDCDHIIVIDASEIHSSPGAIKVFENEQMDRFITSGNKKSVHEVSLVDVMSMAMLTGRLPARRALIGIQPQHLDWGNEPSAAVQAAIPLACNEVENLIGKWQ